MLLNAHLLSYYGLYINFLRLILVPYQCQFDCLVQPDFIDWQFLIQSLLDCLSIVEA